MAQPADIATGTLSTTGTGTEDSLAQTEAVGSFRLRVDLNDMAAGDIIQIRISVMTLTAGTVRYAISQWFYGAQDANALIWDSEFVATTLTDANSLRFSITQTKGTAGISLPWAIQQWT